MFGHVKVGDVVVICSGKPHFQKERRRITHVDPVRQTFEAANEVFDMVTGQNRYALRGAAFGTRSAFLPEGENLQKAIRGEMIKRLASLHVRDLKKVSDLGLTKAMSSLGLELKI